MFYFKTKTFPIQAFALQFLIWSRAISFLISSRYMIFDLTINCLIICLIISAFPFFPHFPPSSIVRCYYIRIVVFILSNSWLYRLFRNVSCFSCMSSYFPLGVPSNLSSFLWLVQTKLTAWRNFNIIDLGKSQVRSERSCMRSMVEKHLFSL